MATTGAEDGRAHSDAISAATSEARTLDKLFNYYQHFATTFTFQDVSFLRDADKLSVKKIRFADVIIFCGFGSGDQARTAAVLRELRFGPARCQLATRDGDMCGAVLYRGLRHCALCGKGPAHLRVHTALATIMRQDLERAPQLRLPILRHLH